MPLESYVVAKGKRPDKKEKLLNRKNITETVVKCALSGSIRCNELDSKSTIIDAINKRVYNYSRRVHAATLALSYIVKKQFDHVNDVTTVDTIDVWNTTLLRQLMLGT